MSNTIKVRRGALADLPESLEAGEFGFAVDTYQVFIGDGVDNHELEILERKGIANGYAELDGDALIPIDQMPVGILLADGSIELTDDWDSGDDHYIINHGIKFAEVISDGHDPTGINDVSESELSFDDDPLSGTYRYFYIIPTDTTFLYYLNGIKYASAEKSVQIANTTGLHYIYIDLAGDLVSSLTPWEFGNDIVMIALVYFRADGEDAMIFGERHGFAMSWNTHKYLHETIGCRFGYGLAGTFNDNNTFVIAAGSLHDEDLEISISPETTCRILYRDAAGKWIFTAESTAFFLEDTDVIQYDDASGTPQDVGNAQFVAYWIYGTNEVNCPILSIMGQRTDSTIANAKANALPSALALGVLPTPEMRLLYRIIIKRNGTDETVEEVTDYRTASALPTSNYTPTSHSSLTDLDRKEDHQWAVWTDGSNPLTADWDIGDGNAIILDEIHGRSETLRIQSVGNDSSIEIEDLVLTLEVVDGVEEAYVSIASDWYESYVMKDDWNMYAGIYYSDYYMNIEVLEPGYYASIYLQEGVVTIDGAVKIQDMTNAGFVKNAITTGLLSGGNAIVLADLPSMTSAEFATKISDETGTGKVVFDTSPTLITPILGSAIATTIATNEITPHAIKAHNTRKILTLEGIKIEQGLRSSFADLSTGNKYWRALVAVGDDVYGTTENSAIWKSTNGGAFAALPSGSKNWWGITACGSDLYASVYGGSIWKSTDDGANWTDLVTGNKNWGGMTSVGTDVYAAVYNGSIWKSTDGGANWTDLVTGSKYWRALTSAGRDIYGTVSTGAGSGSIWKSTNGSAFVNLGATSLWYHGITSIGNDLYVVVYGGSIWKSSDGGVSWTDLSTGNKNWSGLASVGNDVYAAVYNGSIWKSTYAGNVIIDGDYEINGALNHDGLTVGFYGVAPVSKGAALTAQLTTITHTAPGTPDYAIQDLVQPAGFGFVTKDEGNSVLAVIANLQARVAQVEARLGSSTGVGLF